MIGLFCLIIGLFCLIIGLLHTGLKFGNSLYSVEFLPQSGDEASQFDKTFSLRFPFGRSLLPYNRSLLPYNRSLLPCNRSLLTLTHTCIEG